MKNPGLATVVRRAIGILTAIFTCLVSVGVVVGLNNRQAEQQSDLFVNYKAIMPGLSTEKLKLYTCQYAAPTINSAFTINECRITPQDDHFSRVIVKFSAGQIQEISFDIAGALETGELAQQWGRPHSIEKLGEWFLLTWDFGASAVADRAGNFHYRLPVRWVWFSRQES